MFVPCLLLFPLNGTALILFQEALCFGQLAFIKFAFKSFEGQTLERFVLLLVQNKNYGFRLMDACTHTVLFHHVMYLLETFL